MGRDIDVVVPRSRAQRAVGTGFALGTAVCLVGGLGYAWFAPDAGTLRLWTWVSYAVALAITLAVGHNLPRRRPFFARRGGGVLFVVVAPLVALAGGIVVFGVESWLLGVLWHTGANPDENFHLTHWFWVVGWPFALVHVVCHLLAQQWVGEET